MGWWKIDSVESGGISHELPSGHPRDGKTVRNAIPGRDTPEDLYNGDGPADILGAALKRIDTVYQETWGRHAKPDEMRAAFNFVFNAWLQRVHTPQPTAAAM